MSSLDRQRDRERAAARADWTSAFPDWQAEDVAKWRKVFPNGPDAYHARGEILMVAHTLAMASAGALPAVTITEDVARRLADRLLRARDEWELAEQRPRPVVHVLPAPRTICLRCGAPYEEVENG